MADYDFTSLSPLDFEILTADLLGAHAELTFESFGPGPDRGIDLRYAVDGSTIVQCKHFARTGRDGLLAALKKEAKKWSETQTPQRYIIATSVSMSPAFKDKIVEVMSPVLPLTQSDILGKEDLNALLREHPQIELTHFKLWIASTAVMSRLMHSGIWARSESLLESIEARDKYYVKNKNYAQVLQTLAATGLCVVSGDPGVGKSFLAEMALLSHSAKQWQVVRVSEDMKEGDEAWNINVPQIFYYDDFLGQTSVAESLGKNEGSRISSFIERVSRAGVGHKRFILTTRTQVLREAVEIDDQLRAANLADQARLVQVGSYSTYERGAILFNHLYFLEVSMSARQELAKDSELLNFVHHRNYNPRIVELVLQACDGTAEGFRSKMSASLENPSDLWSASFGSLSQVARDLLVSRVGSDFLVGV